MALAADAGLRPPCAHQLKFVGLTVRKIWHILCVCVSRPVTLTFWPWNWCVMYHVSWGTLLAILVIQRLFVFDLWANTAHTDHVTLRPWPWRSWRLRLMRVVVLHPYTKFEVRRLWHSEDIAHHVSAFMGLVTVIWPFDIETGMRVASKVGNLPSKFGHASPLRSRIIRYIRDGRRDKSIYYAPSYRRGIIKERAWPPQFCLSVIAEWLGNTVNGMTQLFTRLLLEARGTTQ